LIAGYFLWGRVAARKGHHLVLMACTLGVGLYPVATAIVPAQVWLPLVAVVQGFFVTGIDLAFFDTLLHVCPADRRPSFIAVNSVFMHLAMTLAPLAGSLLADWLGIRTVLFLAGGIHLLSAVLFWLFRIADDRG
jgi:MFS family permease